jgi:hypothetical protein
MAFSDEERRVLEEMERQLSGSIADVVNPSPRRANVTLITIGVLVLFAGVGVLLAGVVLQFPLIGVAGFGVMMVGAMLTVNRRGEVRPPSKPRSASKLADRWERRLDGDL